MGKFQNSSQQIKCKQCYFEYSSFERTCAWGQKRNEEEKKDEEKPAEGEEGIEKEPEAEKPLGEEYDFIVSGGIGAADSPEVKVWRVENDRIKQIHSLTGHSLGIVSVDVSPNGKCKSIQEFPKSSEALSEFITNA